MDKIVISDTNILIDLYEVNLLRSLFSLEVEIHTLDLVLVEIKNASLKEELDDLIHEGVLLVNRVTEELMPGVLDLMSGNLSITDCAVWYFAKQNDWSLLSRDKRLRAKAKADGVIVRSVFYILDELLIAKRIDSSYAADKLDFLYKRNPRLPSEEVAKRLHDWTLLTPNNSE